MNLNTTPTGRMVLEIPLPLRLRGRPFTECYEWAARSIHGLPSLAELTSEFAMWQRLLGRGLDVRFTFPL